MDVRSDNCSCLGSFRSLREAGFDHERKADEEEEVDYQEMHAESLLERIIYVRGGLWTDTGTNNGVLL